MPPQTRANSPMPQPADSSSRSAVARCAAQAKIERTSAEGVLSRAHDVLERERERLRPIVSGELELTGGSSLAGALTGGDIDLHLRVAPSAFASTVELLRELYDVVHPEIWSDTLATFGSRDPNEDVGIAITPIDSEHDRRFRSAWAQLRRDPNALATYNAIKTTHADSDPTVYQDAKAAFFDRLAKDDDDERRRPSPA